MSAQNMPATVEEFSEWLYRKSSAAESRLEDANSEELRELVIEHGKISCVRILLLDFAEERKRNGGAA